MDTIFTLGDTPEGNVKINLDDLYERKKQHDLNTIAIYNRILNRIHTKIKVVSRQQIATQCCWFVVPEMMIGVPKYDNNNCTAYIIDKLQENGFLVKYTTPNLLFISWKHWIPSYVRNEIKKKTGMVIDGYGNKVDKNDDNNQIVSNIDSGSPESLIFNKNSNNKIGDGNNSNKNNFKSIDTYIPSGNLIYNKSLLRNIEDKLKNN
tara:strand:- start:644 stop:1261 length:618 start_codon:yes stop_codon:yes gene_type:complete